MYVRKKTGKLRICVDYRELNKRTETTAYSLPLADEVQDRLAGASIFTKLDFKSGFWQVAIDPDDAHKTAFSPGPGMGLFEFNRMPFGLNGAPGAMQRLMDKLLEGMNCAMGYIDDILVYSSSVESHKKDLSAVLKKVKEAGITLRGLKCRIGVKEVSYLGHVFSASGMSPDMEKIKIIQQWPQPTTILDVHGLASYYRRYIRVLS